MSAEQMGRKAFDARIRKARAEGKAGQAQILVRLAGLSHEELAKVSPSVISLLGPKGLGMLSAMRRDIPTGTAVRLSTAARTAVGSLPVPGSNHGSWRIWFCCAVLLGAGPIFDLCRPSIESVFDSGARPAAASTWPPCPRLDVYTDGCLYRIGGASTSARQLARHLGMSLERLVATNPHLNPHADTPLAKGTPIAVWRGKLALDR